MLGWLSLARVNMQSLQIDFVPAIVVLGIVAMFAIGLEIWFAHLKRAAARRTNELLRSLSEHDKPRSG